MHKTTVHNFLCILSMNYYTLKVLLGYTKELKASYTWFSPGRKTNSISSNYIITNASAINAHPATSIVFIASDGEDDWVTWNKLCNIQ